MSQTVKVTISLPEEVLAAVEQEREGTQESRSEFFRSAVEHLIRSRREREAEERYVRGYREQPESEAEAWQNWPVASQMLAGEPWE